MVPQELVTGSLSSIASGRITPKFGTFSKPIDTRQS